MGKIVSLQQLKKYVQKEKTLGKKIGFCNGNYDLLHPGHAMHFASAKKMCDVLIVAVASDAQVKRQKGRGRPVFTEKLRLYMVGQILSVDYVILNKENNGESFLRALKPDVYIRGSDYFGVKPNAEFVKEINTARSVGCVVRYTKDKKLASRDIVQAIREYKTYRP